jgi:hypothetical protein
MSGDWGRQKSGFGELRTAKDLLRKLEHDYVRMVNAPADTYAAFDFFVTAEHVLDWHLPGNVNGTRRKLERKNDKLLALLSHVANGGKHFNDLRPGHKSVDDVDVQTRVSPLAGIGAIPFVPGVSIPGGMPFVPPPSDYVCITENGVTRHAIDIAHQVLEYWRKRLGP